MNVWTVFAAQIQKLWHFVCGKHHQGDKVAGISRVWEIYMTFSVRATRVFSLRHGVDRNQKTLTKMEESWNELWSFEDVEAVKAAASKTLGNCGVSLPRRGSDKISSTSSSRSPQASFGVPLTYGQQPTVIYKYGDNGRFKVPRWVTLVAAAVCNTVRERSFLPQVTIIELWADWVKMFW